MTMMTMMMMMMMMMTMMTLQNPSKHHSSLNHHCTSLLFPSVGLKFPDMSKPETLQKKYVGKVSDKTLPLPPYLIHSTHEPPSTPTSIFTSPLTSTRTSTYLLSLIIDIDIDYLPVPPQNYHPRGWQGIEARPAVHEGVATHGSRR